MQHKAFNINRSICFFFMKLINIIMLLYNGQKELEVEEEEKQMC